MARQILMRPEPAPRLAPALCPAPHRRVASARIGFALLALAALQGCGDYTTDYPSLAPTEELLREPALPAHAAEAAATGDSVRNRLEAQRDGLQGARPTPDNGDLAQRAKDLRARAEALRNADAAAPAAPTDGQPQSTSADTTSSQSAGQPANQPAAPNSAGNPEDQTSECPDTKGDCTSPSNR